MATEVLVPPLGQTVDTVTLVAWYKEEGEAVAQGEMLFAIETDKAILDVEAPAAGFLRRVTARPGDRVQVLTAIAVIAAAGEAVATVPDAAPAAGPATGTAGPAPVARPASAGPARTAGGRVLISPRARRLAEDRQVPWAGLTPSGPQGAIVERDVRAYLEARRVPAVTPVARRVAEAAGVDWRSLPGSGRGGRVTRQDVELALTPAPGEVAAEVRGTIPLQGVRAVIAERMQSSTVTTARVTLNVEADASALVALRAQRQQDGPPVAYDDLLLAILGRALGEHPALNASLQGEAIRLWSRVDVGLAVDTERGLLVPVLRDVDRKGLDRLAAERQALVDRARAGRCTPDELGGGTFTLTNLGMFGIDSFTPIINLPECAILGVGRIKKQPAVAGDQVVVRHMVWLSLSFDHRLVDGAPAARFLQRVVQLVERPHLLLE